MDPEERREQNRMRILQEAAVLFTEHGVLTTTIAQIARASHVVDKTVLNIFGTKEKLVSEAMAFVSGAVKVHIDELTSREEYLALNGLEQVMFLQKARSGVLQRNPQQLLLLSEVKVMLARSGAGREITLVYMESVDYIYEVVKRALERGISDGSVRSGLDMDGTLSMLVPAFQAFLQQLAQVKLNTEFSGRVDVEKELQRYLDTVYLIVAAKK